MTSIDWTKLINWIVEGFIGVIFGAMSMYIAYVVNKKWEQKKEQKKKELEGNNRWLMPNGLPPANVSEAIQQAKREGHNVLIWQKSAMIAMLFVVIGAGMAVFATLTSRYMIPSYPIPQTQIVSFIPTPTESLIIILPPTSISIIATPTIEQTNYAKTLCPIPIKQSVVDSWKIGATDISTVNSFINKFDNERVDNSGLFAKGITIPTGVVIAISFNEANPNEWTQYPVIAIVHYGNWGLFQTTDDFVAPSAGACRVVIQ